MLLEFYFLVTLNLDQMFQENVNKMHSLIRCFHLHQRSQYSAHVQGSILDLIFDSRKWESVLWIPFSYSDHFILCTDF